MLTFSKLIFMRLGFDYNNYSCSSQYLYRGWLVGGLEMHGYLVPN